MGGYYSEREARLAKGTAESRIEKLNLEITNLNVALERKSEKIVGLEKEELKIKSALGAKSDQIFLLEKRIIEQETIIFQARLNSLFLTGNPLSLPH